MLRWTISHMFHLVQVLQQRVLLRRLLKVHLLLDPFLKLLRPRLDPSGGSSPVNHKACVAIWVAWYNFARVNTAVRMTPYMASGITSTIWIMRDLLEVKCS
jgi:hypothetical protein